MSNTKNVTFAFAALAMVITYTMDFTGYTQFSALPLLGLVLVYWLFARHSWKDWGFGLGKPADYALAVIYPLFVMGVLGLILIATGQSFSEVDWVKILKNFAMVGGSTALVVFLTEEGFFRGSLFAGFKNAGFSPSKIIILTSVLFAAWHLGWATVTVEGKLPLHQLPVYLVNAGLLGMAWGLMRQKSGSVLAPALSHGVWNGMAYTLFGLGTTEGLLALNDVTLYGPERGLLGILLNGAFVFWMWRRTFR